jgi:hypothetical protein
VKIEEAQSVESQNLCSILKKLLFGMIEVHCNAGTTKNGR